MAYHGPDEERQMLHRVRMTCFQALQNLQRLLAESAFLDLGSTIFAEIFAGSNIPVYFEVILDQPGAEYQ